MSLKRKMTNDKSKDGSNSNNNCEHFITIAATIFTLALIMAASSVATTPVAATPTTGNTTATSNATTTTPLSSSGIELSPQPIFQERSPPGNITPINETHGVLTFTGNGTLTLPNTTQTINTTSNGTAIISFATSSGYAKETIRAANGESATATLFEIVQFNNPATAPEGGGKGIVTAVFQTNSTGTLAPLNGMIAAGIDDMSPSGESHVTLWRWESGISSNSSGVSTSPSTNTTTSTQGTPSTNSSSNTTTTTSNEASQPSSSSSPLTSLY
jgi:hypothetical protein